MEAFSHFDFSLYNEIESSKKNDLKHLLVKKKSINFGTLKTIKSFAYEETIFYHLPPDFVIASPKNLRQRV